MSAALKSSETIALSAYSLELLREALVGTQEEESAERSVLTLDRKE